MGSCGKELSSRSGPLWEQSCSPDHKIEQTDWWEACSVGFEQESEPKNHKTVPWGSGGRKPMPSVVQISTSF